MHPPGAYFFSFFPISSPPISSPLSLPPFFPFLFPCSLFPFLTLYPCPLCSPCSRPSGIRPLTHPFPFSVRSRLVYSQTIPPPTQTKAQNKAKNKAEKWVQKRCKMANNGLISRLSPFYTYKKNKIKFAHHKRKNTPSL